MDQVLDIDLMIRYINVLIAVSIQEDTKMQVPHSKTWRKSVDIWNLHIFNVFENGRGLRCSFPMVRGRHPPPFWPVHLHMALGLLNYQQQLGLFRCDVWFCQTNPVFKFHQYGDPRVIWKITQIIAVPDYLVQFWYKTLEESNTSDEKMNLDNK